MIHVSGRTGQDVGSFHHAIQNDMQFKTYELFLEFSFNIFGLQLTTGN